MKVFSFCLYGTKTKYVKGMHQNIKLIGEKFPDFTVFIYYGIDAPIDEFNNYKNVVLIPGKFSENQFFWGELKLIAGMVFC